MEQVAGGVTADRLAGLQQVDVGEVDSGFAEVVAARVFVVVGFGPDSVFGRACGGGHGVEQVDAFHRGQGHGAVVPAYAGLP